MKSCDALVLREKLNERQIRLLKAFDRLNPEEQENLISYQQRLLRMQERKADSHCCIDQKF